MMNKCCGTCDCWEREGNSDNGACYRFPPTPFPIPFKQSNVIGLDRPQLGSISFYPVLNKNQRACEEWRNEKGE